MILDVVTKGTTDYSCMVRVVDSSDGTPETSVAYNTAGVDLWYRRPGGAHSSITEATQTEGGAHSDGGFVHVSDGYCRLDLPDAAVASGVDYVDVGGTFTDMIVIGGRIRLTDVDLDDAVRGGMTAMPNANADAAGGLPVSDAGGLDLDGVLSGNTPQTGDSYARIGAPAGASIAADLVAIEGQTDDIGAAGAGLTGIPWNSSWDAEVQSEVQDAIEANHLDHLLAADYDPASKPGVATALLNELVENDGGVSRFTSNALEEAAQTAMTVGTINSNVITAAALAADAVTEIWGEVCETQGSYTAQQIMSICLAVLAGETSSSGNTISTPDGVSTRVAATTASNERTAMTLTPSS